MGSFLTVHLRGRDKLHISFTSTISNGKQQPTPNNDPIIKYGSNTGSESLKCDKVKSNVKLLEMNCWSTKTSNILKFQ